MIPDRGDGTIDGDQVFATMVTNLLPVGLRGLVVAGLLSALMSSLASLFNSCATLFTVDIYEKIRPGMTAKHLVTVGRVATAFVVVAGIIWIPIMHNMAGGGLYRYLQSVQSYLAPPIAAVFLLGLFWKRANQTGSFWGLIIGFVLGMGKMSVEAFVASNEIAPGFLTWFAEFNFLYYSGVLLFISIGIVVAFSYLSAAIDPAKIKGITFSTLSAQDKKEIRESWDRTDIILTVIILGLVIGMYLYFSFWLMW